MLSRSRAAFDELKQGLWDIEFLADADTGELRIGSTTARHNVQKAFASSARNPDNGRGRIARILFLDMGGAVSPNGTPRPLIDTLNAAVVGTLDDPGVRQKLEAQGCEIPRPERQTPEALRAYQEAEIEKRSPVIKAAGIKPE